MALQIDYTDETGTQHAEAYARVFSIRVKYDVPSAQVYVDIYHNVGARSKSDAAARKKSIKSIDYVLTGSAFTTYLQDSVIKADGVSLLSSVYAWLGQHNDGTATHDEAGSKLANEGNGINWTTATDV